MAPNQQPDSETAPPQNEDTQEAELFAASAAEGAITDRKEHSDAQHLRHLTISTDNAPLDETEPPQTDPSEQPDRLLSKEQLVEEALNCPCIASMRDGPCGDSFIAAYRCFLESETDPKGMDCMDQFKNMQGCIADHPEDYNLDDDDDADPFVAQKAAPTQDPHPQSSTPSAEMRDPSPVTPPSSVPS